MAKLSVMKVFNLLSVILGFACVARANNLNNETNPVTRITDLNFDCMERVCTYLDGKDLVNVALADDRLTDAAYYSFRHKIIHISDCNREENVIDEIIRKGDPPQAKDNDLKWSEFKSGRIFLNSTLAREKMPIFGEDVREIIINFYQMEEPQKLLDAIAEFCSGTLISIEFNFRGMNERISNQIDLSRPFPKVENLVIQTSFGDNSVFQFNKWFPGVKSLKITGVGVHRYAEFLNGPIPSLISFGVTIREGSGISNSEFKSFLEKNRQVRSLDIHHSGSLFHRNSTELFEFISETLPELEELTWEEYGIGNRDEICGPPLKFPNLKKFHCRHSNCNKLWKFLELDHSLQHLSLRLEGIQPNVVDFIKNNTDLSMLSIECRLSMRHLKLRDIISSLPKLTEFYLIGFPLDLEPELSTLLTDYKSLNKIQLVCLFDDEDIWSIYEHLRHWKYFSESYVRRVDSVTNAKYYIKTFERRSISSH